MNQKSEKFKLSWLCPQTGKKQPAGMAFYNEEQGDFRLKIDVFPEEKLIYLKTTSVDEQKAHYRIEAAVRRQGQRSMHRSEIGSGYALVGEGFPIYMDIGPYTRQLVLEQR